MDSTPPGLCQKSKPIPCRTYVVTPQVNGKSDAQVARWVSPPGGVTNACGLKPEGQGKRKRRNPLTVRLSDSERELIRTRAQETGVSLNAYIRSSVLGSPYKPNPNRLEALRALNLELTKQGSNLNQIARQLNSNLMEQADTNSMLGVMARAYLQSHRAIRDALSQGNTEKE